MKSSKLRLSGVGMVLLVALSIWVRQAVNHSPATKTPQRAVFGTSMPHAPRVLASGETESQAHYTADESVRARSEAAVASNGGQHTSARPGRHKSEKRREAPAESGRHESPNIAQNNGDGSEADRSAAGSEDDRAATTNARQTAAKKKPSKMRSVAVIAGSAAAGAAIGGITGGGKGAVIGAAIGGTGGYVYDRVSRKRAADNGPGHIDLTPEPDPARDQRLVSRYATPTFVSR